jgi:cytochrome c553
MKKILAGLLLIVPLGAYATTDAGNSKSQACAACHGPDGNSSNAAYPNLAEQTARYLYLQLKDFKERRRKDPVMSPLAANLSKEDMLDLSEYFAAQKGKPSGFKADSGKVALGAKKSNEVLCTMCHLGGFSGRNEIPRLSGQQYDYIVKQLKDFKARKRTSDAGNMTSVAQTLSDDDIVNLAHYIANLN